MGEKRKEKKENCNLACTLFFQSWFSKAAIDARSHNPAHCSLQLHWCEVRVQHYLEWGKKNKIITTKYFLSQLELLIQLQHSGTEESVRKLESFDSLQAASGSSLSTWVFLTVSGLSSESCGNASFLSMFLCSKPIPRMKKGSNWWLDILSFIPGLLIKVRLKQLWWNQTAKNAL